MRVPRSIGGFAGIALVVGLFAATPALRASAAPPAPLWVNGSATVGTNTSCASPGYNTISSALTAAPSGRTINVCAGTYVEQLVIVKAVTLKAQGSVTVVGPEVPPDNATSCDADGPNNEDAVDICVPGRVVITGFTLEGGFDEAYCNDDYYGIAVLGGATLVLSQSTVEHDGGPNPGGCQGGIGIEVGESISPTAADQGHATLTSDTITTYQKGGIVVDGTGSTATMKSVTVTGAGPAPIAQNGIQISDGAKATISSAIVTGNECDPVAVPTCGPDADTDYQSIGILLYDAGKSTIQSSTATGNDIGVYNYGDAATSYYTPPSPYNIVETFSKMTLANRYENAVADSGSTVLNGSRITGGETGLTVFQYDGQPTAAKFSGTQDTFTGASIAAVNIDTDDSVSDFPITAAITHSSMDLSNAAGVINDTSPVPSVVNATDDWWGNGSGPSDWSFGSGSSVSAWTNFFPWALTSARTSFRGCTTGTNLSTTGNNVVLCAPAGTAAATLTNAGTGHVLLLGNAGSDTLTGSGSTGETWIIAGVGSNLINGNNGPGGTGTGGGFVEFRGHALGDTYENLNGYQTDQPI